jgi:hypothetical protein
MLSVRWVGGLGCVTLLALAACGSDGESGEAGGVEDPSSGSGTSTTLGAAAGSNGDASAAADAPVAADGAADGGGEDAGAGPCVGAAADPAAATTVGAFLDKLPSNKPTGALRSQIIDAVIASCHVFGPPASSNPGWQRQHCWAHLVSAIQKESSYSATVSVKDAYATRAIGNAKANDPTVGLLQIRFSSTVHDYVALGRPDSLACVGCTFPAAVTAHQAEPGSSSFWAVTGPTQNLALMQSAACNVGLGAWYYYVYATANGKPTATTQLDAYCAGGGTGANLVTGLLSHLEGPDGGRGILGSMAALNARQGSDPGGYAYVTGIKTLFDTMIPAAGGTHPFFVGLAPSASQYCR